jgi:predicted ATP-grasp superfamily ATP-dependent carboligase
MISSPYPFFQSLSREIGQMQDDYRNMSPLTPEEMKTTVEGFRQDCVPVLTDGAFANQLAIVRGHGKEGYATVVLDSDEQALAFYSRFAVPVLSPDYMAAPLDFWKMVVKVGVCVREAGKVPVLVIGDTDWLLESLIEFGLSKVEKVFALNQDYKLQWQLQDKYLQYQIAVEAGVPVPDTWQVDDDFFVEKPDLSFPVLLKERRGKSLFKNTGKQAFEANSWEEVLAIKEQFSDTGLLIQEKISDEGQENMYSIGAFYSKEKKPVAFFSSQRLRATRAYGSTALSVSKPCPDGIRHATNLLREVGYHGGCELEFIYDGKRHQLLFLELNNRLYKTQSLATHCGVNFNYLALRDAMQKTLSRVNGQVYGPSWWLAWADMASGVRKMNKGELLLSDFMKPLSFDFVNGIDELDDPLPGFVNLFRGRF